MDIKSAHNATARARRRSIELTFNISSLSNATSVPVSLGEKMGCATFELSSIVNSIGWLILKFPPISWYVRKPSEPRSAFCGVMLVE